MAVMESERMAAMMLVGLAAPVTAPMMLMSSKHI